MRFTDNGPKMKMTPMEVNGMGSPVQDKPRGTIPGLKSRQQSWPLLNRPGLSATSSIPVLPYIRQSTRSKQQNVFICPSFSSFKLKTRHFYAMKWALDSCSNWTKYFKQKEPSRCGTRHGTCTKLAISKCMGSGGDPCFCTKFRLVLYIMRRQLHHRWKTPGFHRTGW